MSKVDNLLVTQVSIFSRFCYDKVSNDIRANGYRNTNGYGLDHSVNYDGGLKTRRFFTIKPPNCYFFNFLLE